MNPIAGCIRLFHDFVCWVLCFFLPHRKIIIDGKLYLCRFFLGGRGTDKQEFLHYIRLKDLDRQLHDHPWDFTTRVVLGGYTETCIVPWTGRDGVFLWDFMIRPGRVHERRAEHQHRVAHVKPGTWTRVTTGPARRNWGFVDVTLEIETRRVLNQTWTAHEDWLQTKGRPIPLEDQIKS